MRPAQQTALYEHYPAALIDGLVLSLFGKPLVDAPRWILGAQGQYAQASYAPYGYTRTVRRIGRYNLPRCH